MLVCKKNMNSLLKYMLCNIPIYSCASQRYACLCTQYAMKKIIFSG